MVTSTNVFMASLEQWMQAVRDGNFHAAHHHAKHLVLSGELLTIHPDFIRCFGSHYPQMQPMDALRVVAQFLLCATDGRARTVQHGPSREHPETHN